MAAFFRSHIAFPETIWVESFTMESGSVVLIEDTQGHAQTPRRFRLGDYRPMNEEAVDLFDAARAARALVSDGIPWVHDFITASIQSRLNDFITASIQSRLNGFIGRKTTDATMKQMRSLVEHALFDDVRVGRIRDFSVAVTAAGQIEVKATLPATLRRDERYQMTFEVK